MNPRIYTPQRRKFPWTGLLWMFAFVGLVVSVAIGLTTPAPTNPATHLATFAPSNHPRTYPAMVAILKWAETHPNTRILLDADITLDAADSFYVRGDGTSIEGVAGHEATINVLSNYPMGGTAFTVIPVVGNALPYSGQTQGGLWGCMVGTVTRLAQAKGAANTTFIEPIAPVEPASTRRPSFDYQQFYPTPILCRGIVIKNVRIRFKNQQAMMGIHIHYADTVLIENAIALKAAGESIPITCVAVGSTRVTMHNCRFDEMGFDSCTYSHVLGCVGGSGMEEMCRWCTVENSVLTHFYIGDITCEGNDLINCRFTPTAGGSIELPGGTQTSVIGNDFSLGGILWLGGDTDDCTIKYNTGPTNVAPFGDYSSRKNHNVLGNSWENE